MLQRLGNPCSRKADLTGLNYSKLTLSRVLDCLEIEKVAHLNLKLNPLREEGYKILAD